MDKTIRSYISRCLSCLGKSGNGCNAKRIDLPKCPFVQPFEFVSIDIVGPLPVQQSGYRFLLTIIDHASRWLEAVPLTNIRADTCARAFVNEWVCRYGPPAKLHSDRGTQFTSALLALTLKGYGIQKTFTTPYHPQGNSILERVHRTLKDRIISSNQNWLSGLKNAVYDINRTECNSTGSSPMETVFGRHGFPLGDWPSVERFKKQCFYGSPNIGDNVCIRRHNLSSSLEPKFEGNYLVMARPSPNVAKLNNGVSYNIRNLRKISSGRSVT